MIPQSEIGDSTWRHLSTMPTRSGVGMSLSRLQLWVARAAAIAAALAVTASCVPQGGPPPSPVLPSSLLVSTSAERAGSADLNGASLERLLYIRARPPTAVDSVRLLIDGVEVRT